eukprot:4857899-Pyramimonas_sp.AAC.1
MPGQEASVAPSSAQRSPPRIVRPPDNPDSSGTFDHRIFDKRIRTYKIIQTYRAHKTTMSAKAREVASDDSEEAVDNATTYDSWISDLSNNSAARVH